MDIIESIAIDHLVANPANPRGPVTPESVQELADNIRQHGILQRLLVTPNGSPNTYTIVIGHRRHMAARIAGLSEVPCTVREMTEQEQQEIMLIENLQREDLSPIQEARAYQVLLGSGGSINDLARRISKSWSHVRSRMELLGLPERVQELVDRRELAPSVAKVLLGLDDPALQTSYALRVRLWGLGERRLSYLINQHQRKRNPEPAAEAPTRKPAAPRPKAATWQETLAGLSEQRGGMPWPRLTSTVQQTCRACEMGGMEDICRECPLPVLVRRLLEAMS